MDFYHSFQFLKQHPMFQNAFGECLDIAVVKVDPLTKRIEDDSSRNTETAVWLECGEHAGPNEKYNYHDPRLDCGGRSFEEAIIKMASLVRKYYGGGSRYRGTNVER